MRLFLVVLLLAVLTSSLPIYGQTINVSVTDWMMLRTELARCKALLPSLNEEIATLRENLAVAKSSQETSQEKIAALEKQLQEALDRQIQLQELVQSLEDQSTELGRLLIDIQLDLDRSEEKRIKDIVGLTKLYERRLLIGKIVLGTLIVVAVGEAIYIAIDAISNK